MHCKVQTHSKLVHSNEVYICARTFKVNLLVKSVNTYGWISICINYYLNEVIYIYDKHDKQCVYK